MKKILIAVTIALAACSVNKVPFSTGGSRSDGTVEMAYTFGAFESPKVDWNAAQIEADQRCGAWGYKSAERFGGEKRICQFTDANGICATWQVSMNYQCLADKAPQ
jgi:hypothetical protein